MQRQAAIVTVLLLPLAIGSCSGGGSSPNTQSAAAIEAPSPAEVYAAGTGAGGMLQVGDQLYEMRYAYVSDVATLPELRYIGWPDRVVHIVVADRPVDPADAYVNGLNLSGSGFGNYIGVNVTVDPGTDEVITGGVVFPFDMTHPVFLDQIVRKKGVRFTPDPTPADAILGVLATSQPIGTGNGRYSFEIAIGTDNVAVSVPQSVLEGAEAQASPQGIAYTTYINAIVTRDAAAMSAVTTDQHPKTITPGDEFLVGVVPNAPLPESIAKIYVYETNAVIWVSVADGPDYFGQLELTNGQWLVAPFVLRKED